MESGGLGDRDRSDIRGPEFQAILAVDYDDGRMFPLLESYPKCLLPVANRKLLGFQLDMLAKSGIAETYVVAPSEYETPLTQFLAEYVRSSMSVELVLVDEYSGSADAVRAVESRLRGDFVVVSADFLSQFSLVDLARQHRSQMSDFTTFFATSSKDSLRDDIDSDFVVYGADGRVYMKSPVLDSEEEGQFEIPKQLIRRARTFSLRHDLMDMGVYMCASWIKELIVAHPEWSSVRSDLAPYLLERQFQTPEYLCKNIPTIAGRNRPSDFLHASPESIPGKGLNESVLSFAANSPTVGGDADTSSIAGRGERHQDLLRCFGVIYDAVSSAPPTSANAAAVPGVVLSRVLHIASYLALNKELASMNYSSRTPWTRPGLYLRKETSAVGEGVDLSDKTIAVKQCCVGHHVKIGAKSKLNNTVVMEHVSIGENCTIQNCVISERAIIENNCNLNDCVIGAGFRVTANSKVKGEQLVDSSS